VRLATIINLGQKVVLSVDEHDYFNRSWVQFQVMEQISLHRDGADKPDKDYGAVAAATGAALVAWTPPRAIAQAATGNAAAPPADPRYNAFDWETWHEIDVLRRELSPRLEAKKP